MSKIIESTPLMRQYLSIKAQYPGALLLFRVGDFYETFLEDALKTSKILGIVLTKRANGSASSVALAGFPYHALELYLPKLVQAGCRVAICDQLEDPKQAKGIVQRGVTELVTPGLLLYEAVLDKRCNNYLASIVFAKDGLGISFLDLSTGEFLLAVGNQDYIQKLLQHLVPSEVLFNKKHQTLWDDFSAKNFVAHAMEDWVFQFDYAYSLLTTHFETISLKGFGIVDYPAGIIAAGVIMHYLKETEHTEIKHITAISRLEEHQYIWLDQFTIKALELIVPQQPNGIALVDILDKTVTPMGARLLKKWLLFPLKEVVEIQKRLDIVEFFVLHTPVIALLSDCLKQIGDLERLIAKIAVGRVNPREMIALKNALEQIHPIERALEHADFPFLDTLRFQDCRLLAERIHTTLREHPPLLLNQGGIIQPHMDDRLDVLHGIMHTGKDYLVQLQQKESQKTHIPSLKIAYNRVFGYYFEVSNVHKDKVPVDWIRKQTLANAERYVTEELKNYEEDIVHATEKSYLLEQQLYQELVQYAKGFIEPIQQNAKYIAQLDLYLTFAKQACSGNYSKPKVDTGTMLTLESSRHPVIEQRLPIGTPYIPNDIFLNQEDQQIMVITGPNMVGKSALLRQVALIVLMAQMGSFVPAASAHIGVVDKIFTRVGASDNLAQGESTFMMEMMETASIMHNLSDRSLVLMDEIGRGTSTYDGIAIAWALIEYLHNHPRCKAKTLFATHYHELNELASLLPRVKNYRVTVEEVAGKILFLHKLVSGGSQHSFGIHVAQMAGMPPMIVERAMVLLDHLSAKVGTIASEEVLHIPPLQDISTKPLYEDQQWGQLQAMLEELDINAMTPVEALLKLGAIKELFNNTM